MKTSFRAFGIGLFIAGMCLALLNHFGLSPASDQSAVYKKEIQALEEELATLQQELHTPQQETGQETNKPLEEDVTPLPPSSKPVDVTSATIFVYEGMTLYEIGQQIEGEGIVTNGREVELYLSRPEYARSVQKGSFDLYAGMSLEEIANKLTGK